MAESTDYKAFKKHVPEPLDRLDRIENMMLNGMPDTNFCAEGRECWIELKSPTEPKRPSTKLFGSNHKLSIEQRNWMLRQRNAGGKAYVLIVTDKRWLLLDGSKADQINDMTVAELIEASLWHATKPIRSKEEWKRCRQILTR